jgi:hypothetical protein
MAGVRTASGRDRITKGLEGPRLSSKACFRNARDLYDPVAIAPGSDTGLFFLLMGFADFIRSSVENPS